jgi:RNA polymerase sigma-70 factor, ECF subfamily
MSNSENEPLSMEHLRPYLRTLARMQVETHLQAKIDASDIVQQTMLEAHRGAERFQGTTEQELRAWLRRILAHNLADEVRRFRREKRNAGLEQSLEAKLAESSVGLERCLAGNFSSPDNRAIRSEQLAQLASAIDSLPDDQRTAVSLHYLQGQTAAEIGRAMNKTEIAVAGLLRRGLKRLRESLKTAEE